MIEDIWVESFAVRHVLPLPSPVLIIRLSAIVELYPFLIFLTEGPDLSYSP